MIAIGIIVIYGYFIVFFSKREIYTRSLNTNINQNYRINEKRNPIVTNDDIIIKNNAVEYIVT